LVQLWDLTTGKKRASMPGHLNGDLSIGFTPDGKTLVTAGDAELKLWDVATAKERATIVIPGGSYPFLPLAFTADSKP
jgi:WD40 repeat protein